MSTSRNVGTAFDVSTWPVLPKLRGLFITATDTDVGKTVVAGAIARHLRSRDRRVEVFKPAASGCRRRREGLVSPDAEFLAACAESRRTLAEITPVRYAAALAPNVAAQREGRPVDLSAIFDAYASLEGACDCVIVEGVGGLLCPISDAFWVVHMAMLAALPLVIVARPGLGTINHTLLTLHAARAAGLPVAGVVVNRMPVEIMDCPPDRPIGPDDAVAMRTNPDQIAQRGEVRVLAVLPDDPDTDVDRATLGQMSQMAIDRVDWWRWMA